MGYSGIKIAWKNRIQGTPAMALLGLWLIARAFVRLGENRGKRNNV
jgi:hypothetical protein